MGLTNIAVAGATGNIGRAVVTALLEAKEFQVTALSRHASNSASSFPPSVKITEVDYEDPNSLTKALRGQDALICTLSFESIPVQRPLIDAAIASGVKRIIPAEFATDFRNENMCRIHSFQSRVKIFQFLQERTPGTSLTYTTVNCGCIFDIALERGSVLKLHDCTARLFDDGSQVFSASRLETVAKAVIGILEHPAETANRAVFVQDFAASQNELLDIAKRITPGKEWTFQHVDTAALMAKSDEAVAAGADPASIAVRVPYLLRSIWGVGGDYGGCFKNLDNELFGIKEMSRIDIENLMKNVVS